VYRCPAGNIAWIKHVLKLLPYSTADHYSRRAGNVTGATAKVRQKVPEYLPATLLSWGVDGT